DVSDARRHGPGARPRDHRAAEKGDALALFHLTPEAGGKLGGPPAARAIVWSSNAQRHFVRSRTPASAARAPATTLDVSSAASLPPRLRMRPSTTTVSTFSGPAAPRTTRPAPLPPPVF